MILSVTIQSVNVTALGAIKGTRVNICICLLAIKRSVLAISKLIECRQHLLGLFLLLGLGGQFAQAETITIGKGTGIVWEGLPFNVSLSGAMGYHVLNPEYGLLSVSDNQERCIDTGELTMVAGIQGLLIAPGVILVPRATGTANYKLSGGALESLSGTLGLPETQGLAGTTPVVSYGSTRWCLAPRMAEVSNFYEENYIRTANIAGTWVMITDGTQTSSEITVPPMYAGSFSATYEGDLYTVILPSNITLRISALDCTIGTPTEINFGAVEHNDNEHSELASLTNSLTVACSQGVDDGDTPVNANINLQFQPISGLFEGDSYSLALDQGGGYITGEISNGITGSGDCDLSSGISFDGTQIKMGEIRETESNKVLTHQVTWRLCSGGDDLPMGQVTAAADMIVTFN